jgi:hypothetical protein
MASLHTVGDSTALVDTGERRRIGLTQRAGFVAWALLALVVVGSTLVGYYGYQRHRIALDETDALRGQLASASARAAGTDERLMKAEAELSRAQGVLGHTLGGGSPCPASQK